MYTVNSKFELGERAIFQEGAGGYVQVVAILPVFSVEETRVRYQIETSEGKVHIIPEEELRKVGDKTLQNPYPGQRASQICRTHGWIL